MAPDTSVVLGGQSESQRTDVAFHLTDLRRAYDHRSYVRLIEHESQSDGCQIDVTLSRDLRELSEQSLEWCPTTEFIDHEPILDQGTVRQMRWFLALQPTGG